MTLDTLRELLAYNTWANTRLLEAVARLDSDQFTRVVGGSYPSVQATLTHMIWAEWVWLERWHGRSRTELFTPEEFPSVSQCTTRWRQIQAAQEAFVAALAPDDLHRIVRYTNRKGEVWEYALWRQIHHVVNHSTYHRGQVINMLRVLGAQPATTDLLEFCDERGNTRVTP